MYSYIDDTVKNALKSLNELEKDHSIEFIYCEILDSKLKALINLKKRINYADKTK